MKKNKNKELELSKGIKKVISKSCCFAFDFNKKNSLRVSLDVETTHFRIWVWDKQNRLVKFFDLTDNTFIYPGDLNELSLFEKSVESVLAKIIQRSKGGV